MNKPRTIDGKLNHIINSANEIGYTIRKILYCNEGWGITYTNFDNNIHFTHAYYGQLKHCVDAEYRRIVLKKKERGGFYLTENVKPK